MYFYGLLLRKILKILQFFQYTEIYETMENVDIASFYRICVLAAIITIRLLTLKILCGDEGLISVFRFLCEAIFSVYFSVDLPFILLKKVLSYNIDYSSLNFHYCIP